MKRIFILQLLFFISVGVFSQNASTFQRNGKYGLKDSNNKTIVKPEYDRIFLFIDECFLTLKDGKVGLLANTGRTIMEPVFDKIDGFEEGCYKVTLNGKCGLIGHSGKILLPIEYENLSKLTNYLYIVNKGSKKGLITKFGNEVTPVIYENIEMFSDVLILLKGNKSMKLVDNLGTEILSGNFDSIEKLPSCNLYKVTSGNKTGLMTTSGKMLVDPVFDNLDFSDIHCIKLQKDGKLGFLINYQTVVPAIFDKIVFSQNDLGVIVVKQGDLNGFVTTDGVVVKPQYDNISRFSARGHAFVEKKGKLMYVNTKGKELSLQEVAGNPRF